MAKILSISGFGWDAEKKMLQVEKAIYAKDKAIGDARESFMGAIEDMDQQIENHPLNVESESDDDVNSTHSASYPLQEREQRMDEKVNKVLEEVMKLDGISPSEALEVATILMAEEHKL
ncbi:hypothetical protein RDABS01_020659 [Bienertia sinuspersici]